MYAICHDLYNLNYFYISDNANITYSFSYDLTKRKGKDYFDVNSIKANLLYKVEKSHYKFDNLFGGNKLLSKYNNYLLLQIHRLVYSVLFLKLS